jgi:hypothetical protein
MEKAHAVIPIEMYDELKNQTGALEIFKSTNNALGEKLQIALKAIEFLILNELNPPAPSRGKLDVVSFLSEMGIEIESPYAGQRSLGRITINIK